MGRISWITYIKHNNFYVRDAQPSVRLTLSQPSIDALNIHDERLNKQ